MDNYLAQALIDIGKALPGQLRANRLEKMNAEDKRRQYMSDDLANELSKLQIQSEKNKILTDQTARDRDKAALDALAEATSGMQRQKQFSDLNKLEEQAGIKPADYNIMSNREVAVSSGIPKFAGSDRAKDFMSTFVEKPEELASKEKIAEQKGKGTAGAAVWSQKKALMEQDPEAIPKLKKQIEGLRSTGVLSDVSADYFLDRLTTDPVTTAINIDDYVKKPEIAGRTIDAQTEPKVNQKRALIEPTAATTAATTAAGENTKREIQAGNPILSEAQGGALSDSYNAVNYLNKLKTALQSNNLGYFDIDRKTGQFANPDAADAFMQLVEIVGRKRSGAAISEGEWKNFGKQILNKNNLLTDAGKKTALEGIDRYLDKFYGAGVTTTGNEDWYNNYKSKSSSARQKAEGTTEPPATSAVDKLKAAAKSGNSKAQQYLKSKGLSW